MKINRKLATLATTAVIALGGLAVAPSASATEAPSAQGMWGGYENCGARRHRVYASRRAGTGMVVVDGPGIWYVGTAPYAFNSRSFPGDSGRGAWYVGGNAATAGRHACF